MHNYYCNSIYASSDRVVYNLTQSCMKKKIIKSNIYRKCCAQYWISPGGNTPQSTNYMATCLPSRKLSKLDEPDMQDTAREAGTSS